ncbi:myb-related protein MYBAS1-like isoform X1 [Zingiber officinale]|uniref:Uncharacterized protein n=1 Tax=Zingiber officinale TaxID=94328 RepID=A0A8J5FJ73_ZINOF|nr:myb-related protein MYBAS1-like isoform X1 [Zingiber officinale]KAG6488518.1 hypothetical protein ZIOFF_049761 [Zingiber officinale]
MAAAGRKGPWTEEEDARLVFVVRLFGERRWDNVAKVSGLNRSGKSCRLRWVNYLHPGLKHGPLTPHEQRLVIQLHAKWGNRWSRIALCLPGRTDNEIKNYWRTHTRKKAEELRMSSPSSLSSQSSSSNSEVVGQGPVVDGDGDGDGYSMDQIWDEISASESSRMLEDCSESVLWELDDEECLQIWI